MICGFADLGGELLETLALGCAEWADAQPMDLSTRTCPEILSSAFWAGNCLPGCAAVGGSLVLSSFILDKVEKELGRLHPCQLLSPL